MSAIPTYGELSQNASAAAEALAALTTGAVPVKTAGGYADSVYTNAGATLATATAAGTGWTLGGTFAPTSGSAAYALQAISLTVNQTGGANGAVTAFKVSLTETAAVGQTVLMDLQVGGTSRWKILGTAPIQSAAGATWDAFKAASFTQRFLGNTRINSQINKVAIYAPTLESDTATLTVDKAATMYIDGPPVAGTNVTITDKAALVVASGRVGFGTAIPGSHGEVEMRAAVATAGTAPANLAVVDTSSASAGHGGSILFVGAYSGTVLTSAALIRAEKVNSTGGDYSFNLGFYTRVNGGLLVEGMVLTDTSNLCIGATAAGATASKTLALTNGATSPSASADLVHLYGKDIAAGRATLAIYCEEAVAADVGLASTHSFTKFINGAKYKEMLVAVA